MNKLKIIIPLLIILSITFASLLPSLRNNFVSWDDDVFLMNNKLIKDLSLNNIVRILIPSQENICNPLFFLSLALEYHFFKLDPFFYHLINLIFHLANCLLVFWLIFLITEGLGISFITALLFGIHPLQVESVAWAFQLRNQLAAFFFLWALILYLCYHSSRLSKYYYMSLASFILSLLSKPMGITLPFVLVIIDYLKRRKSDAYVYLDKIPFFCISVSIAIMTLMLFSDLSVNSKEESLKSLLSLPYQISFYLDKALLPVKLSCLYPNITKLEVYKLPLRILYPMLLVFLTASIIVSRRHTRKIIFGSLFFLFLLLPVFFFHAHYEAPYIFADHYAYLALIGISYLVAEGFFWLIRSKASSFPAIRVSLMLISLLVAATLSFMTYQRSRVWKDSITLWSDVIKHYPDVATAYINRGVFFLVKKEYDLAVSDLQKAIALEPYATEPYINLCALYNERGEYSRTVALSNKLITTKVPDAKIYVNLGIAYNGLGKTQEARAALMKALSLDPGYLDVYYALAEIYLKEGDTEKALDCYKQAIAKDPHNIGVYNHLIDVQARLGNHSQVIRLCEKLLEFNPNDAQAYCNLGVAYGSLGDFNASIRYSLQALKLDSKLALAHSNLAVAYYYTQQYSLAVEHCGQALRLGAKVNPEFLKLLEASSPSFP